MTDDNEYYRRRLGEELAAAAWAHCPQAAAAHRELAEIYRILLDQEDGPKVVLLKPDARLPGA